MAKLHGREYTRKQLLQYAGNPSNFAGITKMAYDEGKAKGVGALQVKTGSGLEFTLLPDKCLDIFTLSYRGITLSQQAKNSLTGPTYGQAVPGQFAKSVSGGMLFTAGLLNVGPESVEDDGTFHQTHGDIGVTPAENLCSSARWEGDEYIITAQGRMRESALFKHNLTLTRTITTKMGSNELEINDSLENDSLHNEEFCILYHFNFGFPFLTENTRLILPENDCTPRTPEALAGLADAEKMMLPDKHFFEHVFIRKPINKDGHATVRVENDELGIGAYISYELEHLPILSQWKSMRAGDYALGIEPCNTYLNGRQAERVNATIARIDGGKKIDFKLKLGVYDL